LVWKTCDGQEIFILINRIFYTGIEYSKLL
jgi:hypothetical protein